MKIKYIALYILLLLSAIKGFAQNTSDSLKILEIRDLMKKNKCQKALELTNKLSLDYKDNVDYYRLMGEVYECTQNYSLSIEFYNKYLKKFSGNDSIRKRIDYADSILSAKEKQSKKSAKLNSENNDDKISGSRAHILQGTYVEKYMGLALYLGDEAKNANKLGISFTNLWTKTSKNTNAVWKLGFNLHYFTAHNNKFYANISGTGDSLTKINLSVGVEIKGECLKPIFYDKNEALLMGVNFGLRRIQILSSEISYVGPNYADDVKGFSTATAGITWQYIHKKFTTSLDIIRYIRPDFNVKTDINHSSAKGLSTTGIVVNMGYRLEWDN